MLGSETRYNHARLSRPYSNESCDTDETQCLHPMRVVSKTAGIYGEGIHILMELVE